MLRRSEAARGAPGGCGASQRTLPGGGGDAPRTNPRRGPGASGARGAARGAGESAAPPGPGAPRGGGRRAAGGGRRAATATQRRGDAVRPRGGVGPRPRVGAHGDPAGGGSPALASWKPRVGAAPEGLRAPTETALPLIGPGRASGRGRGRGRRVCPERARAEGGRPGSRTCAASERHRQGDEPSPLMYFRERPRAAFPACEARKGWMSEQHDYPLASRLSLF
ncbi:unnamed protein product [Nyctereutes procyonoides]|uniref:(raccoon dog) hypothetical protein n=1 Tax=Nyctereutes procyonoides TaxID=34880 RepID=A0A811XUU3_NYCPR|nr:unnamed protein product [Nyctereutes procyonoides]